MPNHKICCDDLLVKSATSQQQTKVAFLWARVGGTVRQKSESGIASIFSLHGIQLPFGPTMVKYLRLYLMTVLARVSLGFKIIIHHL